MNQKQNLLNCVSNLKEVRAQLQDNLDPRITVELDRVIDQFEFCLAQEVPDPLLIQRTRNEGLKLLALVIESVVAIADLITHLFS